MSYLKILILISTTFFSQISFGQETQPQNIAMPSPYFIDDVHCEGLDFRQIKDSWFFTKEDVAVVNRIKTVKDCEMLFKYFGVSKLEWLPVQDFEIFAEKVKRSEYLKDVKVSLRKSELRNHVHVFLSAKQKKAKKKKVSYEFKNHGQGDQSRQTHLLEGFISDPQYAPHSISAYGIRIESSAAPEPLQSDLYDLDKLNASDRSRLEKNELTTVALLFQNSQLIGKHLRSDLDMELMYYNFSVEEVHSSTLLLDYSFMFNLGRDNWALGNSEIGPSIIIASYTDYDHPHDEGQWILIPGLKFNSSFGSEQASQLKFEFSYVNASNIDHVKMIANITYEHRIHRSFIDHFDLDITTEEVRNAMKPESHYGFKSYSYSSVFLSIGKDLYKSKSGRVDLMVGNEALTLPDSHIVDAMPSAQTSRSKRSSHGGSFSGIRYTHALENWDISVTAKSYDERLF